MLGRRATVALAVALFRMYFVGPRMRGRNAPRPYLAIKSNRLYGPRGSTPAFYGTPVYRRGRFPTLFSRRGTQGPNVALRRGGGMSA